jgi:hypothetical protein
MVLAEIAPLVSARRGHQKIIRRRKPGSASIAYDLSLDAGREVQPVAEETSWPRALGAELESLLAGSRSTNPEQATPAPPEPDFERRLRALGYAD